MRVPLGREASAVSGGPKATAARPRCGMRLPLGGMSWAPHSAASTPKPLTAAGKTVTVLSHWGRLQASTDAQAGEHNDDTPAQAEAIAILDQFAPLTLAELGRYMVCETGSRSRLINTLIDRGLIDRESGQADWRVIQLRLSPEGQTLSARIHDVDRAFDVVTAAALEGGDLEALAGVLRSIVAGLPAGSKVARRFGSPAQP